MELRLAWTIIRRWWPFIAVLTLVGLLAGAQYYQSNRPKYTASVSVAVRVPPPNTDSQAETNLSASQASESLCDDLVQLIPESRFQKALADKVRAQGWDIGSDQITLDPERKHREVNVIVSGLNPDAVLAATQAVGDMIASDPGLWVGLPKDTNQKPPEGNIVDLSSAATLSGGRSLLLMALRVVVGLLAGVAVAFLLNYLDDRVREPQEAAGLLGLPVLGTVPPATGRQRTMQDDLTRRPAQTAAPPASADAGYTTTGR